jgi:hypothetical protein
MFHVPAHKAGTAGQIVNPVGEIITPDEPLRQDITLADYIARKSHIEHALELKHAYAARRIAEAA